MESNNILNEQRIYALVNKVPILRESEIALFTDLIDMYRPYSVLEVGTAIGYSTLLLAQHLADGGKVTSIELDEKRHEVAKSFVEKSAYADRIELICGDANEVLAGIEGKFDLVFLDGPKGQYLKQLKLIMPHLAAGAVVLADNVLFRGYVEKPENSPKRYRTIVQRLIEYLEFVRNKELFNTTIYPMGDGMSVSIYKGKD